MKFVLRYRPEVVADLDTGRKWYEERFARPARKWAVGAHFRRDVSSLRCVLVRHGGSQCRGIAKSKEPLARHIIRLLTESPKERRLDDNA